MSGPYRRSQVGWIVLVAALMPMFALVAIVAMQGVPWATVLVAFIAVIIALTVGWLTVTVDDEAVLIRFGVGLVRRRVALAEVRTAKIESAPWYAGIGMRLITDGWLYNVASGPVVELELGSGRRVQIGTPEPEALLATIEARRPSEYRHTASSNDVSS